MHAGIWNEKFLGFRFRIGIPTEPTPNTLLLLIIFEFENYKFYVYFQFYKSLRPKNDVFLFLTLGNFLKSEYKNQKLVITIGFQMCRLRISAQIFDISTALSYLFYGDVENNPRFSGVAKKV